jgi:fatty acid desaturase
MTHNITDGHVLHHLFFTKIPHYNLKRATKSVRPYLESLGVYRHEYNPFVLIDFVVNNFKYGLYTHSRAKEEWDPSELAKGNYKLEVCQPIKAKKK